MIRIVCRRRFERVRHRAPRAGAVGRGGGRDCEPAGTGDEGGGRGRGGVGGQQ